MGIWREIEQRVDEDSETVDKVSQLISSPDFRSWFSGSKIVGEDGQPTVVYHGTNKEFDRFHPFSFFFNSEIHASQFAEVRAARKGGIASKISGFLAIKSPLWHGMWANTIEVDDFVRGSLLAIYKKKSRLRQFTGLIGKTDEEKINTLVSRLRSHHDWRNSDAYQEYIQIMHDSGHDGILYKYHGSLSNRLPTGKVKAAIILDPDQFWGIGADRPGVVPR